MTEGQDFATHTHPASTNRMRVVDDFLSSTPNSVVSIIDYAIAQIIPGKQLAIRYENLQANDIYNFLPPVIGNDLQLHGLLPLAWNVWQGGWTSFQENMRMNQLPSADRIYSLLNNLTEKSIGNYIVTRKWTNQDQ